MSLGQSIKHRAYYSTAIAVVSCIHFSPPTVVSEADMTRAPNPRETLSSQHARLPACCRRSSYRRFRSAKWRTELPATATIHGAGWISPWLKLLLHICAAAPHWTYECWDGESKDEIIDTVLSSRPGVTFTQ